MLPAAGDLKHRQSSHQGSGNWKQPPKPHDTHHRAAHSQQASPHSTLTAKATASSQATVTGPKRRKGLNTSHQSVVILGHRLKRSQRPNCSCNFHTKKKKKNSSHLLLLRSRVGHVVVCTGRRKILERKACFQLKGT